MMSSNDGSQRQEEGRGAGPGAGAGALGTAEAVKTDLSSNRLGGAPHARCERAGLSRTKAWGPSRWPAKRWRGGACWGSQRMRCCKVVWEQGSTRRVQERREPCLLKCDRD